MGIITMNHTHHSHRKKEKDLPIGNSLGSQLLAGGEINIGICLFDEVNHADTYIKSGCYIQKENGIK